MKQFGVAVVSFFLLLTGCGRVPVSSLPSTSPETSPFEITTPVAVVSPSASDSPKVTPTTTPKSTPTTSRPTPSPTYAPLAVSTPPFHVGEVRIVYSTATLTATGGKTPYMWSVSSGALPGGLALSSGGTVSGTPTTAGTFSFGVQVTDALGGKASTTGSIKVANYLTGNGICTKGCSVERLCVTVCGAYAKPIGGVAPFTYKYSTPPPATTFGWPALGGQFTTTGSYSFTVNVRDSLGASTTVSAIFDVFSHITLKYGTPPGGAVKVQYTYIAYYSGGSGVPTVSIPKGSLPPGLMASVNSTAASVVISGIPTTPGSYSFYLRLTDTSPCGVNYNCYFQTSLLTININ